MTIFSCELLDPAGWKKASEYRREKGRTCYEKYNGNVYCEDTKQGKIRIKKMNKRLYMKKICQNKWKINTELYFPAIWNSAVGGLLISREVQFFVCLKILQIYNYFTVYYLKIYTKF